jgi:4-hydroxy-tetrahydrodipicolinate reductase
MRIAALGASGKVGREVVAQIAAAPDLTLAEAISGANASSLATGLSADVLVDFSTPGAVMDLLDHLSANPLPLVIGTTGFTAEQTTRLKAEGRQRPILIGANFTLGFEAFRKAGLMLATALPEAVLCVEETYNAAKKTAASGTTMGLVADLSSDGRDVATKINRIAETPGINTLHFDLGVARLSLKLEVASRAAYAAGALSAARWLLDQPSGVYAPSDISKKEQS